MLIGKSQWVAVTAAVLGALVLLPVAALAGGGFDQFGYNNTARNFNGTGSSWCQGKLGWDKPTCDAYMGAYANDKLIMKWNAEWDRGNAEGWANPPYAAWTDNQWNGNARGGSGAVWHYKIDWDAGCATSATPSRPGGYCLWGAFEVLMDQGHDPSLGAGHIWFARAVPAGYGSR